MKNILFLIRHDICKNLCRSILTGLIVILSFNACAGDQVDAEKNSAYPAGVSGQPDWSARMADSEILRLGTRLQIGGSDPDAKWNYQTGLFLKSLLDLWSHSKDEKYLSYVRKVVDSFLDESGDIKTYKLDEYNIDNINSGKVLLELYAISGENKYKKAADILREQLRSHPRTKEGGFWHKKRYPWQMWLDGIYMGAPFYARYGLMFNEPDDFNDVAQQIMLIDAYTRDAKTGLRYHGWDESNRMAWADPETGCSPNFWGRALGWYAMALVDVLDYLPQDHPERDRILFILNDLLKAVVRYQDEDSGVWYQVVDQAGRKGNYLESSASSMFVYALLKAGKMNYTVKDMMPEALRGYQGILKQFIRVDDKGLVILTNVCSVAGLGGDPFRDGSYEYYLSEPVVDNDLKGVGPFIMASLQMEMRANK